MWAEKDRARAGSCLLDSLYHKVNNTFSFWVFAGHQNFVCSSMESRLSARQLLVLLFAQIGKPLWDVPYDFYHDLECLFRNGYPAIQKATSHMSHANQLLELLKLPLVESLEIQYRTNPVSRLKFLDSVLRSLYILPFHHVGSLRISPSATAQQQFWQSSHNCDQAMKKHESWMSLTCWTIQPVSLSSLARCPMSTRLRLVLQAFDWRVRMSHLHISIHQCSNELIPLKDNFKIELYFSYI